MGRAARIAMTTALAVGATTALAGAPASASITATASGTTVVATVVGDETVTFTCDAGTSTLMVSGVASTPTMPCATVAQVSVTGDSGAQHIDGTGLDASAFTAKPNLAASPGSGDDTVVGTAQSDLIQMGGGADTVTVPAGGTVDQLISMGQDSGDTIRVLGTAGNDTLMVTSTSAWDFSEFNFVTVLGLSRATEGGTPATAVTPVKGNAAVELIGGDGNDTLGEVAGHPSAGRVTMDGGAGDDTIDAGTLASTTLRGGPGTNTISGGPGDDDIHSASHHDTIDTGAGSVTIHDEDGPRSGGRTITAGGGFLAYQLHVGGDVGAVRVRDDAGSLRFTSSGNRPGQATLPAADELRLVKAATNGPTDLTLFDAVMVPGKGIIASGTPGSQDLLDITVPVGTWTRHDESDTVIVMPNDPSLRPVTASSMDEVSVHGPWTDADEGFVHRSVRDLLYGFVSDQARTERAGALKAGTITRAGFVDDLMALDAYRGYDVDRAFLKFLGRGADPSGRTYWINSIGHGKALWRFRAQLFGSNEYFTKAGGTNAAYITKAYTDVLGRTPDPSGRTYWTKKLDNGADRGQVALQFINSAEARRRTVDDLYLRFLDRLPTTTESVRDGARLRAADGEQAVVRSLVLSAGYAARS